MPHENVMKKVQWDGIKLCAIFGGTIIFSQASVSFKGGRMMLLEEGKTSWDLDTTFRIIITTPYITLACLGGVCRFGFAPHRHGTEKTCSVL